MKAKQDNQPNQEKINSLLDLHKKGESILLEKEVAIELKKYPDFSFLHNFAIRGQRPKAGFSIKKRVRPTRNV